MTCKNKAFSLLEMIVILVLILIISIIAYPVLTQYTTQSKVSDALIAASPIQTLVTNQIASLGSVTGSGDNLNTPATISRYVSSYSVGSDGVISITTTADAGGISLTLTPQYDSTSEQVSWSCAVTDSNMNSSVPSRCRV